MRKNNDAEIAEELTLAVSKSDQTSERLMLSPAARRDKKSKKELAKIILAAMNSAKSIEELMHIERTLQTLDKGKAVTEQDKTSIKNAERDYAQIAKAIRQMRDSPAEYFAANLSIREVGGDFRKMPRSRGLQQIGGNRARLQNRAAFSDENNRTVWDARIALAAKTESMLKTLHDKLAANHGKSMDAQEPPERKRIRKGRGET